MTQSRSGFSRRSLLKTTGLGVGAIVGAGGLSALLSGCSDEKAAGSSANEVTAADVAAATGTIDVLTFSFFQVPELSRGKVKPKFTDVVNSSDIVAKVRSKSTNLGVIDNGQNTMNEMYALDALVPIQTDLLKNYAALDQSLAQSPLLAKDGKIYAVPFSVATMNTLWDSSRVPEPVTADDLLSSDYRNSIAIGDTSDTLYMVHAALTGGMSEMTHDDLDNVTAFLEELRPNVKLLTGGGTIPELFGRGDVSVAFQSYGVYISSAREANPAVKANFLGALSYADCWAVAKEADTAKALSWIDWAIGEKCQVAIAAASGGLASLPSANDPSLLPEEFRNFTLAEILEKAPLMPSLVIEPDGDLVTRTEFEDAWTTYKGSF